MTFTSKEPIDELIENNGVFQPEGIQAHSIWSYEGMNKEPLWAVFTTPQHDMFHSPYVKNPVLLWSLDLGKVT